MPTTVVLRFPWGRYHGTPWGRNVNEGVVDWPPEPWRLLRALYATWRARCPELSTEVVGGLLDQLAEPPEYLVPPHRVAHTRHYYPDAKQGALSRGKDTDLVFDTFAVLERNAELYVTWSFSLDRPHREALSALCERLTYVGRADSVCAARLEEGPPTDVPVGWNRVGPIDRSMSSARCSDVLVAEQPLSLAALEARPQRLRRAGLIEPPGSRRIAYPVVPEAEVGFRLSRPSTQSSVTAVRFRLTSKASPSRFQVLTVTDTFRRTVAKHLDPAGTGRDPSRLLGKDGGNHRRDSDHGHAHYLAFAADPQGADLLDTVVVWAPAGLSDDDIAVLQRVTTLSGRDLRRCLVAMEGSGAIEDLVPGLCGVDAHPSGERGRPVRVARLWRSVTPYAPPRHVRRQPTWEDHAVASLKRDLEAAGHVAVGIEPFLGPWLDFRRHRNAPRERLEHARRATGFTLELEQPVTGPLCFGALRHFGLGLFLPVSAG